MCSHVHSTPRERGNISSFQRYVLRSGLTQRRTANTAPEDIISPSDNARILKVRFLDLLSSIDCVVRVVWGCLFTGCHETGFRTDGIFSDLGVRRLVPAVSDRPSAVSVPVFLMPCSYSPRLCFIYLHGQRRRALREAMSRRHFR